jgi:4-hydroxybenzoate polyprenyltransferase
MTTDNITDPMATPNADIGLGPLAPRPPELPSGRPPVRSTRWRRYSQLMRIDRPIGSLLLLWPTLWALWIAGEGSPSPHYVIIFVLGVFVMRSAGCVINDLCDQRLDAQVERTRNRPLAAGTVSRGEAIGLFLALMVAALFLASFLNTLTLALSVIGAVLAATYPLMKRITDLPQAYLGVAFGWGIPMAFAAQTGAVPALGWLLLGANILWAIAYDTMYAMKDRPDDLRAGARSSAILFGRADKLWLAFFQFATLITLGAVGYQAALWPWFSLGLFAAAGFALYQQYLIRDRDPDACFAAFVNNNWFGGCVFAGILAGYAMQ